MTKGSKGSEFSKSETRTLETTVHLKKVIRGIQFKKRAPRAVREIRQLAEKMMKTKDVRIDTDLNKAIWSNGVRNLATRIRVRLSRRRSDDEDAKEQFYTLVEHVPVESFAGLQTERVQLD